MKTANTPQYRNVHEPRKLYFVRLVFGNSRDDERRDNVFALIDSDAIKNNPNNVTPYYFRELNVGVVNMRMDCAASRQNLRTATHWFYSEMQRDGLTPANIIYGLPQELEGIEFEGGSLFYSSKARLKSPDRSAIRELKRGLRDVENENKYKFDLIRIAKAA